MMNNHYELSKKKIKEYLMTEWEYLMNEYLI